MKFYTEFLNLYIKNSLMFNGVFNIPLNNRGIISVVGINEDANGSNGAGKSTIFDIMRAIHLGSSSDGRRDIDFLSNKGACSIGYTAKYGEDVYSITKNRNDAIFGNNTLILKNGKSVGYKKDANATKKSVHNDFVKIPEAVWDNCVILRTDKAHTLIKGTPTERIDFLSSLCSLNCYDEIYAELKENLKEVTLKIDSLRESEALLADVSSTLSKMSSKKEVVERLSFVVKKINLLTKSISNKEKLKDKIEYLIKYLTELISLNDKLDRCSNDSSEKEKQKQKKLEAELKDSRKELDGVSCELTEYNYYEKMKSNPIGKSGDYDSLTKKNKLCVKKFDDLLLLRAVAEKQKELRLFLKQHICNHCEEDIEKRLRYLSNKKLQCSVLLQVCGHSLCKCPICSSSLNKNDFNLNRRDLEKKLADIVKKIEYAKGLSDLLNKINETKINIKDSESKYGKLVLSSIDEEILLYKEKKRKIEDNLFSVKQHNEYLEKLEKVKSSLKHDKEFLNKRKVLLSSKVESRENEIRTLEKVIGYKEKAEYLETKCGVTRNEAETSLENCLSTRKKLSIKIEKRNEKKSHLLKQEGSLRESLANLQSLLNKKSKLERELASIGSLKKNKDFLTNLVFAYSNKGLKGKRIALILEALKSKLKEYTSILFSEKDISFDIVGDSNKFSIFCIRKDDKGNVVSKYDVRSLSGGEKARFVLAIVFALDDITSPTMKVNFKVLDEIDAKLDSIGKQILIEKFIPMLREKTSTLFIVSHDKEVRDAGIYDARMIVRKKNMRSTIKIKEITNDK